MGTPLRAGVIAAAKRLKQIGQKEGPVPESIGKMQVPPDPGSRLEPTKEAPTRTRNLKGGSTWKEGGIVVPKSTKEKTEQDPYFAGGLGGAGPGDH